MIKTENTKTSLCFSRTGLTTTLFGLLLNNDGQLYDYPECIRTHNVAFTPEEYQIVIRAIPKSDLLLGEYNNTPSATVEDFVASIQLEGIDILNCICNNM